MALLSYTHEQLLSVWDWIGRTSSGRVALDTFKRDLDNHRVEILDVSKWPEAKTQMFGGGFLYDGDKKRIYVPLNLEPELLAPLLLHEIVHATDEAYLQSHAGNELLRLRWLDIARSYLISHVDFVQLRAGYEQVLKAKLAFQVHDQGRLFKTERKAHDFVQAWCSEILANHPAYLTSLQKLNELGYHVELRMTDQEMVTCYDLNVLVDKAA
jgi:hypothetical protein